MSLTFVFPHTSLIMTASISNNNSTPTTFPGTLPPHYTVNSHSFLSTLHRITPGTHLSISLLPPLFPFIPVFSLLIWLPNCPLLSSFLTFFSISPKTPLFVLHYFYSPILLSFSSFLLQYFFSFSMNNDR